MVDFEEQFEATGSAAGWTEDGLVIRLRVDVLKRLLALCDTQERDYATLIVQHGNITGNSKRPARC